MTGELVPTPVESRARAGRAESWGFPVLRPLFFVLALLAPFSTHAGTIADTERQHAPLLAPKPSLSHGQPRGLSRYVDPLAAVAPEGTPPPRDKAGEATITGATFTYTQDGLRESITLSNGIVTRYGYDLSHRLIDLHTRTREGQTIQHHVYTLDATGLRTGVESTDADGNTRSTTYVYDGAKRLTSEVQSENGVEVFNAAYTYDRVGNRKTATVNGVVTTYVYNSRDWLMSETTTGGTAPGTTTYTYDNNGNRKTKTGPLGHIEYEYNEANRMTVLRDGLDRIEFVYDADGLLRRKTFHKPGLPPLTQRFVWDANREVPQVFEELVSENGAPPRLVANYFFADDLIAQTRNGTTSFVIADGMGSTRALADSGGAVTDTFRYDAFGNVIGRSGSTPIDHLYRGEQLDPNVEAYYLRARWMDPKIGAFTQQDTWRGRSREPITLHKYVYANADPVNGRDPSGHMTIGEFATASAILVAGVAAAIGTYDYLTVGRYHDYSVDTKICQSVVLDDPCNSKNVFAGLRRFPAPFYLGDHEVQDGEEKVLPFFGLVVHRVFEPAEIVHNVAQEGHLLYPGTVERSVVDRGGVIYVHTFGWGTGRLGRTNTWFAAPTWHKVDWNIEDYVEQLPQ